MYKNQLQELAQRSCFNLPSYACIREGPDHAPRFKAAVNFNGESFESPTYCSTLRQAEHSAAEVALNALACRGPSNSLAARILDETGVYKNLLQEVSQRVGASLPAYTTFRTGLGHLPVFTCTVELAGVIFTGEPAKNKKQAEKNAAMAAWLSLKSLVQQSETPSEKAHKDEQEHVTVARALQKYLIKARLAGSSFPIKFPTINPRPTSTQSPATTSKILPLIYPKAAPRHRPPTAANTTPIFQKTMKTTQNQPINTFPNETFQSLLDSLKIQPQKFPAVGAEPYIPVRHCTPHTRIAPPVTIRNTVPVFSAPPVCVRQVVPAFAAPIRMDKLPAVHRPIKVEDPRISKSTTARAESPSFKHSSGRFEEPLDSKTVSVFVAAPKSEIAVLKVNPTSSETPIVKVESPVSKVSSPPTSSGASAEETRVAEIEGLKDLKI